MWRLPDIKVPGWNYFDYYWLIISFYHKTFINKSPRINLTRYLNLIHFLALKYQVNQPYLLAGRPVIYDWEPRSKFRRKICILSFFFFLSQNIYRDPLGGAFIILSHSFYRDPREIEGSFLSLKTIFHIFFFHFNKQFSWFLVYHIRDDGEPFFY